MGTTPGEERRMAPRRVAMMILAAAMSAGCALSVDRFVESHDLRKSIVSGGTYRHVVFAPVAQPGGPRLHVYIGGDGVPWEDGRRPSSDPTPRNLLTLELMVRDDTDAVFVGRPCYFGLADDAGCSATDWTSGRYAEKVVSSMTSAIGQIADDGGYEELVLIGYSGGGALARLIASEVPNVVGLLTIAGNLDTAEWTSVRGFLPLTDSINPAEIPPLPEDILHVQAIGLKDRVVPGSVTDTYALGNKNLVVWTFAEFDHTCCWARDWVAILDRFESMLSEYRVSEGPGGR